MGGTAGGTGSEKPVTLALSGNAHKLSMRPHHSFVDAVRFARPGFRPGLFPRLDFSRSHAGGSGFKSARYVERPIR
jgi:hypothetical protein